MSFLSTERRRCDCKRCEAIGSPKGTLEGEDVPYGEWKEQGQRRGNGILSCMMWKNQRIRRLY